jgi:hypothetical protein
MSTRKKAPQIFAKELSWLTFNARVLQEAEDPSVPLIERVRFMGIFSNNLDEFYRVRYADVRRLAVFSKGREKAGWEKLLDDIRDASGDMQARFDAVYRNCLSELRRNSIYLVDERQLDPQQREFVTRYFFSRVLPDTSSDPVSRVRPISVTPMSGLTFSTMYSAAGVGPRGSVLSITAYRVWVGFRARSASQAVKAASSANGPDGIQVQRSAFEPIAAHRPGPCLATSSRSRSTVRPTMASSCRGGQGSRGASVIAKSLESTPRA